MPDREFGFRWTHDPLVAGWRPAGSTCVRWSGDFDLDGDGHVSAREVGNGAMRVGPFDDLR
jgi:hypothetical protein